MKHTERAGEGRGMPELFDPVNTASADDSIYDIQFYWDLVRKKDIRELVSKVQSLLEERGFSDFIYCPLARNGINYLATPNMVATHKASEQSGLDRHDLMLSHVRFVNAPVYMSVIEDYISASPFENETFRYYYELIRLYRCHNINDLYTIPLYGRSSEANAQKNQFVLTVAAAKMPKPDFVELVETHEEELRLLLQVINHVSSRNFPGFFTGPDIQVSKRPLQLLITMAKGNLILKQAASELCISVDTANKHMAAVKEAFDAKTSTAALYRAIKAGFID